jgi:KUP system potassium uptake protein
LLAKLASGAIPRVPGSAVFFTRAARGAPPVLIWHLKHNRALHEHVLILRLSFTSAPRVALEDRLTLAQLAPKFWRADVRFGFMETPDIPLVMTQTHALGCDVDLGDVTYYVGHETIVSRRDGKGLPRWEEAAFALMLRNAARLSDFLKVPSGQIVEIGRQIEI